MARKTGEDIGEDPGKNMGRNVEISGKIARRNLEEYE